MPDLQKLKNEKERIVNIIRQNGPSYPAKISREIGTSPLFVSAYLSELVSEKSLKLSNMKVGGSPIYFIPGEQHKLIQFADYLNSKEREAFELLKSLGVLEDAKQEPAIRVALRKITDFAIALTVRIDNEPKLYWKFFSLSEEEALSKLNSLNNSSPKQKPIPVEPSPNISLAQELLPQNAPKDEKETPTPQTPLTQSDETPQNEPETPSTVIRTPPKKEKPKDTEFSLSVKDFLSAKDIEVLEEISSKKKEFVSKVRLDTLLGKQEFYLIAKDKKNVTENDITIALQKAQTEKMPALIISSGELDKNAKLYHGEWKNLIRFEKIPL